MTERTPAERFDEVICVFQKFDVTGSGVVQMSDFAHVLRHLDGNTWTDVTIRCLLANAEAVERGVVHYERFLRWVFGCESKCLQLPESSDWPPSAGGEELVRMQEYLRPHPEHGRRVLTFSGAERVLEKLEGEISFRNAAGQLVAYSCSKTVLANDAGPHEGVYCFSERSVNGSHMVSYGVVKRALCESEDAVEKVQWAF
mmetsp:Transcript_65277/g.173087  ORF Transcript_65277/g.173087 Transcript_65277/m.173087 type:complete len:200 (-) Transcript_65277:14-613(-)